tara:strand:- start:200 stop:1885 length:1686 start_codon:yes stop_codon:yes gene_type:complete
MAQTLKIKRSTSNAAPSSALAQGELAYSFDSSKLFIGDGSNNDIIGGEVFMNLLDHTAGTLTASSAILVDSNSKIDNLLVDNLQLNGNAISSGSGDIAITPATGSIDLSAAAAEFDIIDNSATALVITEGSNAYLTFKSSNSAEQIITHKQLKVSNAYTLPTADGSNGQALITNGSGSVAFTTISTTLTVGASSGSDVSVSLVSDDLQFTAGEGIDTTVSDSGTTTTITIAAEDATDSNKGVASFSTDNFAVSSGAVTIKDGGVANAELANSAVTVGSTSISLGASATTISGVQQLNVDNLRLDGNELSSTNTDGNVSINPNGAGTVDVNTSKIVNVTDPTSAQDAATKAYVDSVKQALDIKDSVRVATTAAITISSALNNGDTLDGVTLADGDRVLVKDQADASENGIYVVASSPARSTDANSSAKVTAGLFTFVEEGTTNGDNGFVLTTNDAITLDTTNLTFTQFSGAGQITAGDALSKSANTLNVNDDNITLEVNSDNLRIKGISATAVGDLLIGAASNAGYTRLTKPSGDATALTYLLSMNTSGTAQWSNIIDGGTF